MVNTEGARNGAAASNSMSRDLLLQPVAPYNPFEETLAQLARAIRLGAVPVGEKFPPERELGERLGVSRTTVREALRGLEQAGYITTRRGRFGGTFVIRDEAEVPSRGRKRALGAQLMETLDFRAAIEPGAAALAARKADDSQIQQMWGLLAEMDGASQGDYVRMNCRLHIAFAQGSECRPLLKVIAALEMDVMDALLTMPKLDPSIAHSHTQHRAIIEAIAARDFRAARDAMDEHLAGSDVILRELVSSND